MRSSVFLVALSLLAGCPSSDKDDTTGPGRPDCDDADGDGVCDEDDRCDGGDDGVDLDGDGVPDDCDPCPGTSNNSDTDGDGVCDNDDLCEGDDASGDSDGDGVCDDVDDCEGTDDGDADGDGVCDGEDVCDGDDGSGDTDGDGVCDSDDVCQGNDGDGDTDLDGTCDDVDPCPLDGGPGQDDDDGDGVCDSDDLCDGDDLSGDADSDGVCDNLDACPLDPPNDDDDNDGVCDSDDPCPLDPTDSCLNDCVVWFDDAWGALGENGDPNVFYGGDGLSFVEGTGYGLISGEGNGDLGNWNIDGTNGTAAWGLWTGDFAIDLGGPAYDVSLDFLRGHTDYTLTVSYELDGLVVHTEVVSVSGAFDSDTTTYAGPTDRLAWTATTSASGVDNLRYRADRGCPQACLADFEDAWAFLGQGADPTGYYFGYNLFFDPLSGYGLIGGIGNGDPGSWNIEGTEGSAAWGLWPGSQSVIWAEPAHNVSMDFLRGWTDYTFAVTAYDAGAAVGTRTVSLVGNGDVDTTSWTGPIDEVSWTSGGYYGIDAIRWEGTTSCPP